LFRDLLNICKIETQDRKLESSQELSSAAQRRKENGTIHPKGGFVIRTLWIACIALIGLVLAGCSASQASIRQAQENRPQKLPPQEPTPDASESNSPLPQIPEPTVGSVVITNTTATPVSSYSPNASLPDQPTFQSLAQRARQDLANRLGVELDQVEYLKIVPAKWPYDRIGCPLPEEKKLDENHPGYQILLAANGQTYTYHTDGIDWIVSCNVKPANEIRTLP
jgi:hypothetical protein